jgi:integrase
MPQAPRPWFRKQTGWWMAQVNHKQEKLAKGRESKKAAEQKLRDLLTIRDSNPEPESGKQTVASIINRYISFARTRIAPAVLGERERYFQSFAEAHGFREVNDRDCLPYHLTSWLDAHPEWASDWTKHHAVAIIHRPFNWAAKQRLIAANPFRGVTHRPGDPRRPMTDDEFDRLLVAVERNRRPSGDRYPSGRKVCPSDLVRKAGPSPADRFRELLQFHRLTGARPGEAAKLKWTDLDLERAVILLMKHKTSHTQRTPKPRVIPLHPDLVALLIAIKARKEPGENVFYNHRGTLWNRCNMSLRMQRAREKAGIPDDAKLYGLRHAFGIRAIVNQVDIKTLAELMGHTTTRMTEHYLSHLGGQIGHLHAALLKVNGSLPDPSKPE